MERDAICCDVTLQQVETMRALADSGVLQNIELAGRLSIELSTASRNLKILERQGYIRRGRIKEDGRAVGNRLTAKGVRCIESICCDERLVFNAVLARVPANDRAMVTRALACLAEAMEKEGPAPTT